MKQLPDLHSSPMGFVSKTQNTNKKIGKKEKENQIPKKQNSAL